MPKEPVMSVGAALEIVYELARKNIRVDVDGTQQEALNIVHDLIVNHYGEDEIEEN